jgi:hypothetical protein
MIFLVWLVIALLAFMFVTSLVVGRELCDISAAVLLNGIMFFVSGAGLVLTLLWFTFKGVSVTVGG